MQQRLLVLNVEDNPNDSELIQAALVTEWPDAELRRVETEEEFVAAIEGCVFDIILGDYLLTGFDGLKALEIAMEKCPDTPYIFVSGLIGEESAIEALKKGASDYVFKKHLSKIVFAVRRALQEAEHKGKRKNAEAALYESEERYRSMFENNHAVMLVINPDNGAIVNANPAAAAYYGWARDELVRKNISEINTLTPDQIHAEMESARSEKRNNFLFKHRRAHGEPRYVEVYSGPIKVQESVFLYSIIFDVTERKQADEKVKDLIAEKELILKEVHHRIKNNMSIIASLLFLQADKMRNSEAAEALKDSQRRVQSMMVLYDKLYLSHSFMEISFKEYLTSLIEEVMENFSNMSRIKVETHIEDFITNTKILSLLGIIVNEIITNAMKYAFRGGEEGLVSVSATLKDRLVTLVIADNGVGIPESVDMETSPGFGLELVSMLTKQLRGSIKLERADTSAKDLRSWQSADTACGTRFILEFGI